MLTESNGLMVDVALTIVSILDSHQEAKAAMVRACVIPGGGGGRLKLEADQDGMNFQNRLWGRVMGVAVSLVAVLALPSVVPKANNCVNRNDNVSVRNEVKVGVKVKGDEVKVRDDSDVVKCGMKALGEVVDESLKMIRNRMMSDVGRFSGVEKEVRFEKRWREQRMEEFEVLAKRVKLIMENSSVVGK
ncbi:U-box domain-containing protein 11-like protein [Tanacetum coccineum]